MRYNKIPQIGAIVRLRTSHDSPIGGWLEGELATIIEEKGSSFAPILVKLNPQLALIVKQEIEGIKQGAIAVNLSNLEQP